MDKKRILSALVLGCLSYAAWLAYDMQNHAKSTQMSAPLAAPVKLTQQFEKHETQPQPVAHHPIAKMARRSHARDSLKPIASSAKPMQTIEAKDDPESKSEFKSKPEVPLPRAWTGQFENKNRSFVKEQCDLDRPCSPRGRDGVLLVGAALAIDSWQPQFDKILSLGSYRERTPLLVYK